MHLNYFALIATLLLVATCALIESRTSPVNRNTNKVVKRNPQLRNPSEKIANKRARRQTTVSDVSGTESNNLVPNNQASAGSTKQATATNQLLASSHQIDNALGSKQPSAVVPSSSYQSYASEVSDESSSSIAQVDLTEPSVIIEEEVIVVPSGSMYPSGSEVNQPVNLTSSQMAELVDEIYTIEQEEEFMQQMGTVVVEPESSTSAGSQEILVISGVGVSGNVEGVTEAPAISDGNNKKG